MTELIDWQKLKIDSAHREVDAQIKLATARMNLASMSVDIAKKQIENSAEIAKQNRMGQAHREYVRELDKAKRDLRKIEGQQVLVERRKLDLMKLLTTDTPDAARSGWIAVRFFLLRCPQAALAVPHTDLVRFNWLRTSNKTPIGEDRTKLVKLLEALFSEMETIANKTEAEAAKLDDELLKLRSSSWKSINLDPSWIK